MRIGVAHHLGWAVVVTADDDHTVVDRRRVEFVEAGLPAAPVHHVGGAHEMHRRGTPPSDDELAALVATVRASAAQAAATALGALAADLDAQVTSLSVRAWPDDIPSDIAVLRRAPWESRVDSFMYCQVLAEAAGARSWPIHHYDARTVEAEATRILGGRAQPVFHGPRSALGPPWTKDHRTALAATVVARAQESGSA